MNQTSSIDSAEVSKFALHASEWWDLQGPLKTLHDINPTRLAYIQQFGSLKDKLVLDIGCGGGILSEAMAKAGAQVTGLDVEPHALAVAKDHALSQQLNITYECQAVENYLPKSSELFDIVTCLEMLEHVAQPALIIEHAARLLKPGGLLVLSTINRTFKAYFSVIVAAEYVLNLIPKQTHDYSKFIKPSELMTLLRASGFEEESLVGLNYNPFNRQSALAPSVDINYLSVSRKRST